MSLISAHGSLMALGGPVTPTYIGGEFHVDQSASSITLNVPGGAVAGDLVIVVLRCRADRNMTGFTGWTTHVSQVVRSSRPSDSAEARAYIVSRVLGAETSFTFTHSASASYGAALIVIRGGSVGNAALPDSDTVSITKVSSSSLLLAISMGNNRSAIPAPPIVAGYTNHGLTTFLSAGLYYYTAVCETRSGVAAGSVSATMNTLSAGVARNGLWLAEIG